MRRDSKLGRELFLWFVFKLGELIKKFAKGLIRFCRYYFIPSLYRKMDYILYFIEWLGRTVFHEGREIHSNASRTKREEQIRQQMIDDELI